MVGGGLSVPSAGRPGGTELESAFRAVRQVCEHEPVDVQQVVDCLHELVAHYSWVGVYLVTGDELVLGPWRGPAATEHVRIPIGQGVCGAAAASGKTEIVDDVNEDPRYLACFPSTRSEIVVPIDFGGTVVGEIDIDSDQPGAFDRDDQLFLEQVALLIAPAVGAAVPPSWLRGLSVADVMLTTPKTLPSDITVAEAREALANEHVQMLLLTDGAVFRGAVTDIPGHADPASAALAYARPDAETIAATDSAETAYTLTSRNPHRRVIVLDHGALLGLLCLNETRTRFCTGRRGAHTAPQ